MNTYTKTQGGGVPERKSPARGAFAVSRSIQRRRGSNGEPEAPRAAHTHRRPSRYATRAQRWTPASTCSIMNEKVAIDGHARPSASPVHRQSE